MTWPLWVSHQQFCHMVFSVGLFFSWTLPSDPILVGQNQVDLGLLTLTIAYLVQKQTFWIKWHLSELNPWKNLKRAAHSHVWGSNVRGIMVRRILWLWQVKGSSLYAPHWRCVPSNPPNSLSDELDVHSINWFCALYSLYSFSSEVDDDLQPFSRRPELLLYR